MPHVLEIILYSIIGLAVLIYAFFSIRKTVLYNKEFKACIKSGMTKLQAKEYCDKFFNKKKNKEQEKDELYEE